MTREFEEVLERETHFIKSGTEKCERIIGLITKIQQTALCDGLWDSQTFYFK